jgi:intracellular sulfur oxidation DsrE/DsrF family protein
MVDTQKQRVTVIQFTHDGMGHADPELSQRLAQTYLGLLDLQDGLPAAICFYTRGVRLVLEGSPMLEELAALERKGVRLIVCGTCVNHYRVADRVRVGTVGSMKDIVEVQTAADKVITI